MLANIIQTLIVQQTRKRHSHVGVKHYTAYFLFVKQNLYPSNVFLNFCAVEFQFMISIKPKRVLPMQHEFKTKKASRNVFNKVCFDTIQAYGFGSLSLFSENPYNLCWNACRGLHHLTFTPPHTYCAPWRCRQPNHLTVLICMFSISEYIMHTNKKITQVKHFYLYFCRIFYSNFERLDNVKFKYINRRKFNKTQ